MLNKINLWIYYLTSLFCLGYAGREQITSSQSIFVPVNCMHNYLVIQTQTVYRKNRLTNLYILYAIHTQT